MTSSLPDPATWPNERLITFLAGSDEGSQDPRLRKAAMAVAESRGLGPSLDAHMLDLN
jgi:hypothetical protein